MGVTLWIVVAFALGVLFGRLTARGASGTVGGPTGIGSAVGPGSGPGLQFGQTSSTRVTGSADGPFRIVLLDRGRNIINTIKVVRAVTRLDLKSAKDFVDGAPQEIARVNSVEQAQAIAQAFQGVAAVRIDGPGAGDTASGYGSNSVTGSASPINL